MVMIVVKVRVATAAAATAAASCGGRSSFSSRNETNDSNMKG